MVKKLIWFLIIILAGAGVFFAFKKDFKKTTDNLLNNNSSIGSIKRDIKVAQNHVFINKPLRKETVVQELIGQLTISGIIKETNNQRALANLPSLKESNILNQAANLKIDDMFKNQYFEHLSPDGKGPADLAKQVGYNFIIIGENLALGNFKNDQELVNDWMNSPGHRENILRHGYEEIGIAVKQGIFEGKTVWLAIQEFGTPAVSCPMPDKMLIQLIDNNKLELTKQEITINNKKLELESYPNKNSQEYVTLVNEYNNFIQNYNTLVNEIKLKIGEYNSQANAYNICLKNYSEN